MMPADPALSIRPLTDRDHAAWRPLWEAYNAFYGRAGATALAEEVTNATWEGLTNGSGKFHGLLAERRGVAVGMAHYFFHPSTTAPTGLCYLQDLFVDPDTRRRGVAMQLLAAVRSAASLHGVARVYWQTHETNSGAIQLYEAIGRRTGFIVYVAND